VIAWAGERYQKRDQFLEEVKKKIEGIVYGMVSYPSREEYLFRLSNARKINQNF
jgi:hypothetical protein